MHDLKFTCMTLVDLANNFIKPIPYLFKIIYWQPVVKVEIILNGKGKTEGGSTGRLLYNMIMHFPLSKIVCFCAMARKIL